MILIALLGACSSNNKHDDGPPVPPAHDVPASTPTPPTAMPKVHLLVTPAAPQGALAVAVEIVATEAQIERGLMYREHLPPDDGMLFLMDKEKEWAFWMHNTLIPLDIVFIASDFTIAGIVENAEPKTDTLREVNRPSLYVLEVNGGFCAAHKITAGTKVAFEGVPARRSKQ